MRSRSVVLHLQLPVFRLPTYVFHLFQMWGYRVLLFLLFFSRSISRGELKVFLDAEDVEVRTPAKTAFQCTLSMFRI